MKGANKFLTSLIIPAIFLLGFFAFSQNALAVSVDLCQVGDRMCVSNGTYKLCGDYNIDGYLEWSSAYSCPTDTTCSVGQCMGNVAPPVTCTNECTTNQKQCASNGQYQLCGNYDSDTCTEWSTSYTCPTGQTCSNGTCSNTCINQCASTEKMCVSNTTYKTCALDGTGCYAWSSLVNTCPYNTTCANGSCSTNPAPPSCSNECTTNQKQCSSNGQYQLCGNYDSDTCTEWSTSYTCPTGQTCSGSGVCGSTCTNQCSTLGQWACSSEGTYKICQDTNNDGCFEWTRNNNCQTGFYCSESQKACLQLTDHPTTINLTVDKSTALTGDYVNFTLQASDEDGVEKVCFVDSNYSTSPECIDCVGNTCQKNFIRTKQTPGLYIFSGYAVAKKVQGGTGTASSNSVSVLFATSPIVCSSECSIGQTECFGNGVRTCQYQSNNGCLTWSVPTNCGNDTYTDEYRCSNNNNTVQRKIIKKGCSASTCYERQEWVDYDNCQTRDEVCNNSTNKCNSQWLNVSCFAAPSTAKRGELAWVVARVAGGIGPYQFSWTGDFSGGEQTVSKTFFTKGTYNAYLTVKAGDQTKSATCYANVSEEIAVYANHPGTGNIWVSNATVYTGEPFTLTVFGADEDGIDGIEASYQNSWHNQSASGNSATRTWQVTEYTPNRYQYCGKIIGRNLTGARDVSYASPRCVEVWVRSR